MSIRPTLNDTSMTFWTAFETNREEHCLWLTHFFQSLSDVLSSCVWSWSTDPVFLIWHRFSVKCHSYLFFGDTKAEIEKEKFQYLKTVKSKISRRRKASSLFRVKSSSYGVWRLSFAVSSRIWLVAKKETFRKFSLGFTERLKVCFQTKYLSTKGKQVYEIQCI